MVNYCRIYNMKNSETTGKTQQASHILCRGACFYMSVISKYFVYN